MAENKLESIVVKGVEYDIGSSSSISEFPISGDTIKTETEEIIFCEDDKEDEPSVVINKDGIKVKSITDIDGFPITGFISEEYKDKIYAQCGDSISEGAGLTRNEDKISNDDFAYPLRGTAKKTYGYFIARYNNLKWINQGMSGSTLGDVTAYGSYKNGFSHENGRYTQLGDNVDFISLWFGWNDIAYGPVMKRDEWLLETYGTKIYYPRYTDDIGTIHSDGTPYATQEQYDACNAVTGSVGGIEYTNNSEYFKALYRGTSTDNTNKTWYGAFNIILPYLIEKYPFAKILVIVGYGGDSKMWDIGIAAAKKYGVSWIDLSEPGWMNFINTRDNSNEAYGKVYFESTKYENRELYKEYSSEFVSSSQFRYRTLLYDGCHPNVLGYKYIYSRIQYKLLNI